MVCTCIDYYQTTPGGPLTSGYCAMLNITLMDSVKLDRASFYVTDTFRKNRLTLNLGFRFDHQTGENACFQHSCSSWI